MLMSFQSVAVLKLVTIKIVHVESNFINSHIAHLFFFQAPDGLIFPDRATLYVTAIEDRQYKDYKIHCMCQSLNAFQALSAVSEIGHNLIVFVLYFQGGRTFMALIWPVSKKWPLRNL